VLDPETLDLVEVIADGRLPNVHDISFGVDGRAVIAVTGIGAVLDFASLAGPTLPELAILPAPRSEGALLHSNGRIYAMASGTGTLLAYQGGEIVAAAGGHNGAHYVAEGPGGDVWVAHNSARRLVRYSPDLAPLQVLSGPEFGFIGPRYLDVDELGRLIVADQDAHRVLLIDPEAPEGQRLLGVLGTGIPGNAPGQFDDPEGVAVQGNRYFISDSDNNRVVRYIVVMN
jgi:hypothetical protein